MFHVVLKLATVSGAIFVKVLTDSIFNIILPIPNVQLPLNVVVLSFSMLVAFIELPLVSLAVFVGHGTSAMRLIIFYLALIYSSIGSVQGLNVWVAGLGDVV